MDTPPPIPTDDELPPPVPGKDGLPFNIDAALLSGIEVAKGRKTWSGHDRSLTVGASEVGRCLRQTWYNKSKVPYDDSYMQTHGAMERGNAIEDWVVVRLQDALKHDPAWADWELRYAGADQITLVDAPQSATSDGVFVHKRNEFLPIYLEIKSQDPRLYEITTAAKTEHKCQSIQGMGLVRRKLKLMVTHAILIYVNASFVDQYRYWVIPYTEAGDKALRDRASKALDKKSFTVDKPPPAEGMTEGGKECEYCPFRERCILRESGRLPTGIKKVAPMVSAKLKQLAVARAEFRIREHEAEASKKAIEQEIVSILEKHDTKRVQDEWGSVSINKASSPPVPLWDDIEKATGDASKFRRPGTPYIRVNVSLK